MDPTRTHTADMGLARIEGDPVATLTIVYHPDARAIGAAIVVPEAGELRLGRAHDAGLPGVFEGERVSREHALVRRAPSSDGGLVVEDLGSRNGTFVDGQRLDRAAVAPIGAVIGIGDALLRFDVGPRRGPPIADPEVVGISRAIGVTLADVALVAPRDTAVAIVGETGAGKELVARALHRASGRRGALVSVNCGGLADTLVTSELFGHKKGAFTGADRERPGLVEEARGGTLFLDEIADASPVLQAALLRLMETGRYRAVGGNQEREADVRFVVACQPGVEARVADGRFRLDLWNRAARWVIDVPPLRARRDDIPLLALTFARRLASDARVTLAHPLVHALVAHDWPGNVRELSNVVERAVVEARGARELTLSPRVASLVARPSASPEPPARPSLLARVLSRRDPTPRPKREALVALLARHGGNVRAAADELGVMRRTLYRWFKALAIDVSSLRDDAPGEDG